MAKKYGILPYSETTIFLYNQQRPIKMRLISPRFMAEWGAVAEATPNPRTKMLPLREPPTTAHVFPRQNGLSNRTFVDPVTLSAPLIPAITSTFLKAFQLFANFEPEFPENGVRNGNNPPDSERFPPKTISPGDRFRGRSNQQPPSWMAMGNGLPQTQ